MLINSRLFLGFLLAMATLTHATLRAEGLRDDFDGSVLNSNLWSVSQGGGTVELTGGRCVLSAPCNTAFPYVVTRSNPFPATGNYRVRVGFRYPLVNIGGNGIGFSYNQRVFGIWQDACYSSNSPLGCGGLRVAVGDDYPIYLTSRAAVDTSYHVYEWRYVDGVVYFLLDDVLVHQSATGTRPDRFFFGHPPYTYCNWTTQEIDFVDIAPINDPPPSNPQTVCGCANENQTLTLSAPAGQVFRSVEFASYGTPAGACGSFVTSPCHAASSLAVVAAACIGNSSCSIPATNAVFGDPCYGTVKRLCVQATTDAPVSAGRTTWGALKVHYR